MTDMSHRRPSRVSTVAGSLGAILILLSAPAHSLIGWPEIHKQLARLNAPADLVLGLYIGWHFSGAAMIAIGLIVLNVFQSRARGTPTPIMPAWTVAIFYVVFGAVALVVSGFDRFFLAFIVPGGLILLAVLA